MKSVLIGTNNRHKVKEISEILRETPLEIKSLIDFPKVSSVDETGKTLEENAVLKAESYGKMTGLLTIADDTGLEVAALNGEPGVLSARYAGEHCSYEDNNRKLLQELSSEKNRKAKFRCVIACYDPVKNFSQTVEGVLDGEILNEIRGKNGFGYDPVFYLPQFEKTLAELSSEQKNRISHRAIALIKAKEILKTYA